jgi:hypothetical protein
MIFFSNSFNNVFLNVGTKFISPWAKKAMVSCIFVHKFSQFLINISLKVGTIFVSMWSKKMVIGRKNYIRFFISRNYF